MRLRLFRRMRKSCNDKDSAYIGRSMIILSSNPVFIYLKYLVLNDIAQSPITKKRIEVVPRGLLPMFGANYSMVLASVAQCGIHACRSLVRRSNQSFTSRPRISTTTELLSLRLHFSFPLNNQVSVSPLSQHHQNAHQVSQTHHPTTTSLHSSY